MSFNTIIKISLLSACLLIVLLFSCRKEKPEMNAAADPCACASEVSADFTMEEIAMWGTSEIWYSETDSILKNRHVRFKAKEANAEYTWYLGTETEITQETFRQFPSNLAGTNQPIILVVKKEPNSLCFPDDDGYDSVVKYLTATEYPITDLSNNDQILGTKEGVFRLKSKNSSDSVDITIDHVITTSVYVNIYNYDGNETNCIENAQGVATYRETRIDGAVTSCNRLRGYIKTPMSGVVEMYFTEFEPGHSEYKEYHYFGRRVGPL
jgi:hypothetical protein